MSNEKTEEFYSKWSGFYGIFFDNPPIIRSIRKSAVKSLKLEEGDTVVEVGCGTGANFRYLQEEVGSEGKIIGIDLSKGMLEEARKKIIANEWRNVELIEGDASEVDINQTVDGVLFSFSIGMFESPENEISRWSEVVEDGFISNVYISRSRRPFMKPYNILVDIFETVTAPPTFKLRYDEPVSEKNERNKREAFEALKKTSEDFSQESRLLDIIKIDAGKIE